jgi:hypothetical protein
MRKNYYHYLAMKNMYEKGALNDLERFLLDKNIDTKKLCEELLKEVKPHFKATQYALKTLERLRASFNSRLNKKEFFAVNTCLVTLPEEYRLVCCDCNYIDYNIDGSIINTRSINNKLFPSFLTVFPQHGKTYILFSYLKIHRHIFNKLINHIISIKTNELKILFSNIMLGTCETICFSPALWQSYGQQKQDEYTKLYQRDEKYSKLVASLNSDVNFFI